MNKEMSTFFKATCVFAVVASSVAYGQISLLQPSDFIIAIDLDEPEVMGSGQARCGEPGDLFDFAMNPCSPDNEDAPLAFDGTDAKYLNFGRENSGLIITPANGPVAIQSFILQAANDAPGRDPASWRLYGTNDAIMDTHHGTGLVDNWTMVAEGDDAGLNEDPGRLMIGSTVAFENSTVYSSYKMEFVTVRDSIGLADGSIGEAGGNNSMQVSEIEFYSDMAATVNATRNGPPNFTPEPAGNVLAYWNRVELPGGEVIPASSSPGGEGPENAIDGDIDTKYLNFGKENSGVILTLSGGAATVSDIRFTTANDAEPRDPVDFELYGTNEAITTVQHGQGIEENWTLISTGSTGLDGLDRFIEGPMVDVDATLAYDSFRITFPTLSDSAGANSMQVAEIELFGEFGGELGGGGNNGDLVCDLDSDGDCDQDDINMLYAAGTDAAGIDTWLTQASSADNPIKADSADTYILGDANLDGDVNSTDLGLLLNNFGSTSASSAAAVPEPSAIALLFLAAVGMLGLRRRS